MTARNTKGVTICAVRGDASGVPVPLLDVTKDNPAVVTVADASTIAPGDMIDFASDSSGLAELDGKAWIVGDVDGGANTFTLIGADTSASTGTFAAGDDPTQYAPSDFVCFCWSEMTFTPETPETISVGTFCDPTAQLPSAVVGGGTLAFAGYVDVTEEDYPALVDMYESGNSYEFRIYLPENGYVVFPGTVGSLNLDIPLDGALAYNGTITLGSRPKHLF